MQRTSSAGLTALETTSSPPKDLIGSSSTPPTPTGRHIGYGGPTTEHVQAVLRQDDPKMGAMQVAETRVARLCEKAGLIAPYVRGPKYY